MPVRPTVAPDSTRHAPAQLVTATSTLHGTLELPPAGGGPWPVLLIISGSGPTDRDGNPPVSLPPNNSLRLLAESLARRRIATLRYDKRGIAASAAALPAGGEGALRFDTYVDDAAAWLRQLRADRRFTSVGVLGHSEGSLVGLLAAEREHAAPVVSIAGAGRPAGQLVRAQLRPKLPPALMTDAERVIATLEAGRTTDSTPPMLAALFRPSVQPYLVSWFTYDPAAVVTRLGAPVLVVQGTTDIQVDTGDARRLATASPRAVLCVIDGMNHVLKLVPPDHDAQLRSYGDPALPVAPALVDAVAAFVHRPPH